MNTKLSLLVFSSFLAGLAGCTAAGVDGSPHGADTAGGDGLDASAAIAVAQQEVNDVAPLSERDMWTETSVVTEAFPIYMEGVEGVSYFECKVVTEEQDAGYVLVNVNDTDLPVVESATEGRTLYEKYRDASKTDSFKVFRYDWITSAAVADEGADSPIAAVGFDGSDEVRMVEDETVKKQIEEVRGRFRALVTEKGSYPLYTHQALVQMHENAQPRTCADGKCSEYRIVGAELKHSFGSGWHLPSSSQPTYSNGNAIGCGNTAWAMLYAYWSQFKGRNALFDGANLENMYSNAHSDDPAVYKAMAELSEYTDTKWVDGQGMVLPWDMCDGKNYARGLDYRQTTCLRDRDAEFSKIDEAIDEIQADRPTMLLIHADGTGVANHYVAIEGARKRQQYVGGEWSNREAAYLANFGHGNVRKWIYTREVGINSQDIYSSFSAFYVNVK